MNKIETYLRYFYDYLIHGDVRSVIASVNYVLNKRSHAHDRVITTGTGTLFCRKNTNDFQYANYYYEWGVKNYILDHLGEFDVFVDGGACTGIYSILLAQKGMRCLIIEPVPANVSVIRKNLQLNKLTEAIRVFDVGLGETEGQLGFNIDPVNTGASRRLADTEQALEYVHIRTLDSMSGEMGIGSDERILFKLDVEGMEVEALRGAKDFIRKYPYLTFIIEDKHSGKSRIREALDGIASFEYGIVDQFNIYAKKLKN